MKVVKSLDIVNEYIEKLEKENKQLKEIIKEVIRILNSAKNHYGNEGKNWALERAIRILGGKE